MPKMPDLIEEIRIAVASGKLSEPFKAKDLMIACPGWEKGTYSNFLSQHREDNPDGLEEYFVRHFDGGYSLIK